MNKKSKNFNLEINSKVKRKLKALRNPTQDIWSGLGTMGIIGWAVAIPTLLGTAGGIWLDKKYPGKHSWTLALLIIGIFIGCLNAWHWVANEDREMREDQENNDE